MNSSALAESYLTPLGASDTSRANALLQAHLQRIHRQTDRMFAVLMLLQWLGAIAAALWLSPRTWSGAVGQTHIHVWAALLLGGAITVYPVFLALSRPGAVLTRHVIAAAQLLMSGLLIHLTGGRIETHFHVFGSLAFLAFYRDWRVLVTGTLVTVGDHLARGTLFPQSIYGVSELDAWRWVEHGAWVVFEDAFLLLSCYWSLQELRGICERDALLETNNLELEHKVTQRTALLQDANARLEALATTDPLTGLPNHRALVDLIDKEIERARRYARRCSLLFLDLDHFKALNDTCGHSAGDQALNEFGAVIKSSLREMDTLGRWGGEEFVVLLPELEHEAAREVGERLRAAIAEHPFQVGGGLYLTCSVGVATYPEDGPQRSQLVKAADRAMYAAKQLGRNQVLAFADPIVATLGTDGIDSREETILQGTVEALAGLVEARDTYCGQHTEGVVLLAERIAKQMQLEPSEARLVSLVARLRDIGKIAIPDAILQKPGRLNEAEWIKMRRHPIVGAEVISHVPTLRLAAAGIRGHHERWDGTGYPDGLVGENIPLVARIVAVADAFKTIMTERCFRAARSHVEAMQELKRCAGTQFDPAVVRAMEAVYAEAGEEPDLALVLGIGSDLPPLVPNLALAPDASEALVGSARNAGRSVLHSKRWAVSFANRCLAMEPSADLSELDQAYDAMIDGWCLALDLRDHETEGHCQRVTALALKLAQAIGIEGEALVHLRRGAMLHDIGKMGIPDSILLKPGPLTEEEWKIMHQHPRLAYEMLSQIEFLQPALEIPYFHHEKWDGSGYPCGMRGETIPLAARIFAIADVVDALSSDRPYRKAWSPERVREHLRSLSGSHFDPALIEVFLKLPTL